MARDVESACLPDTGLLRVLVGPHRLTTLELASELHVHDAAAVAGVDDGVQPHPVRQGVHQELVQFVVYDLPSLHRYAEGQSLSLSGEFRPNIGHPGS